MQSLRRYRVLGGGTVAVGCAAPLRGAVPPTLRTALARGWRVDDLAIPQTFRRDGWWLALPTLRADPQESAP